MHVLESKIDGFITKLEMGFTFLGDAGKALVDLLDEDPYIFNAIIATNQWVIIAMLKTVESIGRKQLEPSALLLPRHVLNHVAELPINEQLRVLSEPVTVPRGGRHTEPIRKMAKDLTQAEARAVFTPSAVRLNEISEGWFELSLLNGKPFIKRIQRDHGIEIPKLTLRTNGVARFELIKFVAV